MAPLCSPPEGPRRIRLCTKVAYKFIRASPQRWNPAFLAHCIGRGHIYDTPARRNCRARSRTRIGYSTPFIDSSFAVGIEPFEVGAELRLGDWGLGCCGGASDVLERSRARRPPLGSAYCSRTGDSASSIEHEQMPGASLLRVRRQIFSKPSDESQTL